ncbi:hypothetical protein FG479_12640 [Burkholderia pseudomallei]|nr:hypothetical protein [Burkholderia pseudomallei]
MQTANCKLQTGSLDVLRSSAVEARVNWATQSFQTLQPSRIFELRVFEPSRLHVFEISRFRNFTPLEPFSNHSSDSTRPPIRSHRPRCPSCAYRQALSAPGRPASAAWRRRIA